MIKKSPIKQAAHIKNGIEDVRELTKSVEALDPSMVVDPGDFKFDVEQAFQLYTQFLGDVGRTAHALGVPPVDVLRAADRLDWNGKLKTVFEAKNSGKPQDLERAISRAMNFVQAHRMRVILERILAKFYAMSDEELINKCYVTTTKRSKDGTESETQSINAKPFSDLAAALEKVHQMTYAALADSVTERTTRKDTSEDSGVNATQLHQIIAAAMAGHDKNNPAAQLLEAHIAEAGSQE